jgi:hypothetical protein
MTRSLPLLVIGAALFSLTASFAQTPCRQTRSTLEKTATNDVWAAIDINNVFNYYVNNGDGGMNPYTGDDGFELMNANRGQLLFEEGFLWGGVHKGIIKVGGSNYNHGLQAGPIITSGTATTAPVPANPADPQYRVYRVRPDIGPGKAFDAVRALLTEEVSRLSRYETITVQQLYDKYIKDWNEWPAVQGAPYTDANGNGVYDAGVDVPGVTGADQTLWYVANDCDTARAYKVAGSKPIGIEFQRTVWAYNRAGAFANTLFEKNVLINKSGARIDSMGVAEFVDGDIGGTLGYVDDFAGCDTIRGLGFTYNGTNNDGFFGSAPPALGFDLLQGPCVKTGIPSDRAIFKGAYKDGSKNLGMTSFHVHICSNSILACPSGDIETAAREWYNHLNGLGARTGAAYIDPKTGLQTHFVFPSDPVTGRGWMDGSVAPPGDRNYVMCSGMFAMAPGDTQEVVLGAIAAQSSNRLASVALLEYYDDLVQGTYNRLLRFAPAPASPIVIGAELDKEVVLDWSLYDRYSATEYQNSNGYMFEGYNVYQLPSAAGVSPKKLATYDLVNHITTIADEIFSEQYGAIVTVPVQQGSDGGIQRYFDVAKDHINDMPLVNGQPYYFAVTAYNYSADPAAVPATIESPLNVLTVVPRAPTFNDHMNAEVGDTIAVSHTTGKADATMVFRVVNPKSITGHTYEVSIVVLDSITTTSGKSPNSKWQVTDKTAAAVIVPPTNDYTIKSDNPVVHGIQFGVKALPYWVPGQEVAYLAYARSGADINTIKTMTASNWQGVNNGMSFFNGGFDVGVRFTGSSLPANKVDRKIDVRFTASQGQNAYCFTRTASSGTSGAPYTGFFPQPFSVWDITDAGAPRQVDFWFMEGDGSTYKNKVWAPGAASTDREYVYISNESYTTVEKPEFAGKTLGVLCAAKPVLYGGWFTLKDPSKPPYGDGDVWRISPTNFLTTSDVWSFSTARLAPTTDVKNEPVPVSFDLSQNFPNPFNPTTTIRYQLPAASHVTLTIFDVLGREVATLAEGERTAGTYTVVWNVGSNSSGVYFYRLTAGSFVMTKKLMVLH